MSADPTDTPTSDTPTSDTPTTTPVIRHEVFQTSLMSALLDGIYDGEMTVAELLGHGNFGLGTFNHLDGEMIAVDGVAYQMRSDGTVCRARLDQLTPYAVVTNFVPNISSRLPPHLTREQLSAVIDKLTISENYLYALRITGHFAWVTTRTVQRQEPPYPPMMQATDGEPVLRHEDTTGVMVGFRTPLYEQGISVPGCHVHYIDDAREHGGHVMDFLITAGTVELCLGTDLRLSLPLTDAFGRADLAPDDLAEQIHRTEQHG